MAATVRIPTMMRRFVDNAKTLNVNGGTVGEVLEALCYQFPSCCTVLFDENNELHKHINVYVSDEDIRYTGGLDTRLTASDEVAIIPAVAGGC